MMPCSPSSSQHAVRQHADTGPPNKVVQRRHTSRRLGISVSARWLLLLGVDFGERRACELRRIPLLGTWVNKGKKREPGQRLRPDTPTHLRYYGHFFKPPGDVSLFCPPAHLPCGLVSGLPLPGVTVCAAKATPDNDMLSAIISATTNIVMRFLIPSHLLPFIQKDTVGEPGASTHRSKG